MHHKSMPTGISAAQTEKAPPFREAWQLRKSILLLLPVVLWIWLCRDWPTRLGFYSDDWMVLLHPFVGTAEAFRDDLNLVATRPVSAPFIWLAQVFVDWSPVRSQLLNAAMLLVTAASVGLLAAAIVSGVRSLRDGTLACASIAAAAFIVFPSNIGTFVWGVGVSAVVPAVPLFCLATSMLLHAERSLPRLCLGLTVALLSHLSYEAFYFQDAAFVLIAITLRGNGIKDIPWRVLTGILIVNIGCLAFNRLTPGIIQKSFHWEFLQIFVGSYSRVLNILGHAIREHVFLIAISVIVAGLSGSICLARLAGVVRMHFALVMTICGVIASGLLYAFAGYGLAAEGPTARVAIVLATYYSITAGVLAAAAWGAIAKRRLAVLVFWISAGTGLVALNLTARARVGEWADTWSYETARLSRLPTAITSAKMYVAGDRRLYVAIEDRPASFIQPATAPWEIGGAVAWASYKNTNSRLLIVDLWKQAPPRWFATPPNWFNRWNGEHFEQGVCNDGAVIVRASGSELWSWNTSTSELTKIDAPWEHGCQ
jgi:hypothetical protein